MKSLDFIKREGFKETVGKERHNVSSDIRQKDTNNKRLLLKNEISRIITDAKSCQDAVDLAVKRGLEFNEDL